MDPTQLAAAAIAIVAPYLTRLVEKTAGEVVDSVAGKAAEGTTGVVDRLYRAIRSKFHGDRDAEDMLGTLGDKPESEGRQAAAAEVLAEKVAEDRAFASELEELVLQARGDPQVNQFLTNVYGNAKVKNVLNIGLAGDLNIN